MKKYLLATVIFISQLDVSADAGAPVRGALVGFVGGCIAYVCDYINCSIQNQYIKMTQPSEELVHINGASIHGVVVAKKDLKLKKPFDFKKLLITTTVIGLFAGACQA